MNEETRKRFDAWRDDIEDRAEKAKSEKTDRLIAALAVAALIAICQKGL